MTGKPNGKSTGAVSTGSTLLNLACSDRPDVAFFKGGYYFLVGDSASGKSWLSMSCFAELCQLKEFDSYRIIFDDVEGGALMDIEHYFGKALVKRLESPARDKDGTPVNSDTVEDFYYNLSAAIRKGKPFIYVLDSQDALNSEAALKKFNTARKASKTDEKVAGSFGDGKAKYHSEHIRMVLSDIRRMGSILIVISQTRDNLSYGFEKKTRSGGKALRFYANLEIWTSVKEKIERTVRDRDRVIGVNCLAEVKKNRITGKVGKDRSVIFPIYYDHGIDDVGACVDFLIDNKHWVKVEGGYDAKELGTVAGRPKLIRLIEDKNLEPKVRQIVGLVWRELEDECLISRKPRYA